MHIAILHPQCRIQGGAIKMALLAAHALGRQGHHVVLHVFEHDPDCFPVLQQGITIQSHGLDMRAQASLFIRLIRRICPKIYRIVSLAWHVRHVDIIIANNPPMQIVAVLAKYLSRIPRDTPPFFFLLSSFFFRKSEGLKVWWWHHHVPWYLINKESITNKKEKRGGFFLAGKSWLERHIIIPHIDQMITTSEYVADCLRAYCGRASTTIHPVLGGRIDDDRASKLRFPTSESDKKIGAEIGENNSNFALPTSHFATDIILFSHGRLEPGKGFDALVRVWNMLQKEERRKKKEERREEERREEERREEVEGEMNDKKCEDERKHVRLIIAGAGSMKDWLIAQGATVIPYYEGLLYSIQNTQYKIHKSEESRMTSEEGRIENIRHHGAETRDQSGLQNRNFSPQPPTPSIFAIYLSTIDAFGMAPLEAQMAGLPTIILDRGGARETLVDDMSGHPVGRLVEHEDDIPALINYFIQQKSFPKDMSNVNFYKKSAYFSLSRFYRDMQSLIDKS